MAMGLSLGSASVCLEGVGCLSLEIGEGPPRCDYMLSYDTDTSLLSHDYLTAKGGARRHDERRPPERVWRGAPGATWNVFRGLVRPRCALFLRRRGSEASTRTCCRTESCVLCFLLPGVMSDAEEEHDIQQIASVLGAPMNGSKLPAKFARLVSEHMVHTLMMGVDDVDAKDLLSYAADAWADHTGGGALPGSYRNVIGAMLGVAKKKGGSTPLHASSSPSLVGDEDEDAEDDSKLFGEAGATRSELAMLEQDKTTQGISGVRLVCLSVAIELGRVPSAAEVVGVVYYKSDPRLSELAKPFSDPSWKT